MTVVGWARRLRVKTEGAVRRSTAAVLARHFCRSAVLVLGTQPAELGTLRRIVFCRECVMNQHAHILSA